MNGTAILVMIGNENQEREFWGNRFETPIRRICFIHNGQEKQDVKIFSGRFWNGQAALYGWRRNKDAEPD